MGHEDQRHAVAFITLLDDLGHADALCGHAARKITQHAGGVLHHDPHVIAAPFFRRHDGGLGQFLAHKAGVVGTFIAGNGQQIAQHGSGCGQIARAASVEKQRAGGVGVHPHGIVHAAHAGQQKLMVYKGGEHPGFKPDIAFTLSALGAGNLAHLTNKLDAVAKFARKTDIHAGKPANAAHRKGRVRIVHPVGQTDKQDKLVGGIVAVNVQRGVGLGIA